MHCLLKWINTESSKQQCPMDRRPWGNHPLPPHLGDPPQKLTPILTTQSPSETNPPGCHHPARPTCSRRAPEQLTPPARCGGITPDTTQPSIPSSFQQPHCDLCKPAPVVHNRPTDLPTRRDCWQPNSPAWCAEVRRSRGSRTSAWSTPSPTLTVHRTPHPSDIFYAARLCWHPRRPTPAPASPPHPHRPRPPRPSFAWFVVGTVERKSMAGADPWTSRVERGWAARRRMHWTGQRQTAEGVAGVHRRSGLDPKRSGFQWVVAPHLLRRRKPHAWADRPGEP